MVFPRNAEGITNSLRNHHGTMKGLSCAIGRLTKVCPMGYVIPGSLRRFMPKYGSGRCLALTSAATTVVGTVTAYQPCGRNLSVETTSPGESTLYSDCSVQPSLRTSLDCERLVAGCCATASAEPNSNDRPSKS